MAFLEFRVKTRSGKSQSEEHLGSYVLPLDLMRTGYRNVYLENYAGDRLTPASLFVHVKYGDGKDFSDKKSSNASSTGSGGSFTGKIFEPTPKRK